MAAVNKKRLPTAFLKNISPETESGCWELNMAKNSHGYVCVHLWKEPSIGAHRVMFEIVNGPIPKGMCVCHSCDNRGCVNPEHLFLGTDADNLADAARKNRLPHKIENSKIPEIRRLYEEGFLQIEIAKMFGINQGHVSKIISKQRRQHV